MVSCSNFWVVMMLILVSNTWMWQANGCSGRDLRCGPDGPPVRFPFRLKNRESDGCGYAGFDLTCSDEHLTLLELPALPFKFQVIDIDYQQQLLFLLKPENCFMNNLSTLNRNRLSLSPFQSVDDDSSISNFTFFDCRSIVHYPFPKAQFCRPIYIVSSSASVLATNINLLFCNKMFEIPLPLERYMLEDDSLGLKWLKPNCSACETEGKMCKLKKNGTEEDIECYDRYHKPIKKILLYATAVFVGSILVMLMMYMCASIYRYFKVKGEDHARIEKFLEDYRAQNPSRFSYADIRRITDNFKEELGEGAHGAVFKGKLSNEIQVAVKMLNNTVGDGKEFINEVEALGKIHHINVVRLLGFCADECYRALVYSFFPNGSLQNFIAPPDDRERFLGWEKLEQIALGIAKGISYLHQDCDHRILHFDINPHNVLLDDKYIPKISDFGLAKLCAKNQSMVSVTAARGTLGYMAPEVFSRNFASVSHKADIYSYGMLLLEIVGGRKNTSKSSEETSQVLYPEWIHNLLEGRDIHVAIEDEGDNKIVKKLAIVGLWCIQWHPINRPSIKVVLKMLEATEEGDLTVPPNPFDSNPMLEKYSSLELEVIHE